MRSRPRFQSNLTEAEERKRRQEKFRKRTRSLFNKVRLLAKDTDAWVALIVRDRVGQVQSVRSSDIFSWPPSIKDLIRRYPSGNHEYLEKPNISGRSRVTIDESESALDGDTEALEQDVPANKITPVGTKVGSVQRIVVDRSHVAEDAEPRMRASTIQDISTVQVQKRTANKKYGDLTNESVIMSKESNNPDVGGAGESDSQRVSAWEMSSATPDLDGGQNSEMFELGGMGTISVDAAGKSDSMLDAAIVVENTTEMASGATTRNAVDQMDVNPQLYKDNRMEIDAPGANTRIETETRVGDSTEAANGMSQGQPSHSSVDLASWQVVDVPSGGQSSRQKWGPKRLFAMNPRELLEGWDWAFRRR